MIANQMYNIELPSDETFLSSSKNIMIIATIFQQAIKKHLETYNQKEVPLSFIEFYVNEIKNYDYMFRKQTKDFFETYERIAPNFEIIAHVYEKSYFSQISGIKKRKAERFLILRSPRIIDYSDDMTSGGDKDITSAVSNIMKITEHINNSDEIIPFHENYENYMISQIIRKQEFVNKYTGKSRVVLNIYSNKESPRIIAATKHAERLTGERITLAKQKGKVTKIIIPKLKLPSSYPKGTFSRYNSNFRVRNFVSASREILIINDLKVNGVAYSTNFVEKRHAMNEEM